MEGMLMIKLHADGARGIARFWISICMVVPYAKLIAASLPSSDTDGKEYEIESKLDRLGQSIWPIQVQEHVCMRN